MKKFKCIHCNAIYEATKKNKGTGLCEKCLLLQELMQIENQRLKTLFDKKIGENEDLKKIEIEIDKREHEDFFRLRINVLVHKSKDLTIDYINQIVECFEATPVFISPTSAYSFCLYYKKTLR